MSRVNWIVIFWTRIHFLPLAYHAKNPLIFDLLFFSLVEQQNKKSTGERKHKKILIPISKSIWNFFQQSKYQKATPQMEKWIVENVTKQRTEKKVKWKSLKVEREMEINKINNNRGYFPGFFLVYHSKEGKIEVGEKSEHEWALIKAFYVPGCSCWIHKNTHKLSGWRGRGEMKYVKSMWEVENYLRWLGESPPSQLVSQFPTYGPYGTKTSQWKRFFLTKEAPKNQTNFFVLYVKSFLRRGCKIFFFFPIKLGNFISEV